MKKLNALLHDVTLINFVIIAKLLKRYRFAPIAALFVLTLVVPYFYFSQMVIHQKTVHFKVTSKSSESTIKTAFADLVDTNVSFLKKPEILAIVNTYEFTTALAEELVASTSFNELDFTSPLSKTTPAHKALRACTDKVCQVKNLRQIISSLYALDAETGTNRFSLVISTLSKSTTMQILSSFQVALEKTRYNSAIQEMDAQIKQIQSLIVNSRTDLETNGGFDKVANSNFLDALIQQHNEKVRNIAERLSREKNDFHFQQIRLKESNLTANKDIHGSEKLGYEKVSKLRKRSDDLRQNIASINSILPKLRTESDDVILSQLEKELDSTEEQLKVLRNFKRNVAFDDTFINTQINNQSSFEFDFKVVAANLRNLQAEYDASKAELDQLFLKKSKMDNELLTLRPDLEYLKLLESKMVSMKMKKSAAASDVFFDDYGPDVLVFMQNTFIKIFIFSSLLIAFLLILSVVVIYLFDDRIFDEYEISKCCGDLPVIGRTPHFD